LVVFGAVILFGVWLAGALHDADGEGGRQSEPEYGLVTPLAAQTAEQPADSETLVPSGIFGSDTGASGASVAFAGDTEALVEPEASIEAEISSVDTDNCCEPQVAHAAAESPDGNYRIETYGTNRNVTAGGLFPAEGIRLLNIAAERTEWSMPGYYTQSFLWSPDSRYVSVSYMARIWGGTIVVDTSDFSEIGLPGLDEIRKRWDGTTTVNEYRADPYTEAAEWLDDTRLSVKVKWSGSDSIDYSGTYVYDVSTRELTELKANEPIQY